MQYLEKGFSLSETDTNLGVRGVVFSIQVTFDC